MNYVLKNSKDHYLARNKDTHKLYETPALDKAKVYKNIRQAMNMQNKLPMYLGKGWKVVNKDSIEVEVNEVKENAAFDFENLKDVVKSINQSQDKLEKMKDSVTNKERQLEIKTAINKCDLAQSDIIHYIEKNDVPDMYTAWKIMKLLAVVRRKRRLLKRETALAELFTKEEKVTSRFEDEIDRINGKGYTPRQLNDLFNKDIPVKESIEKYTKDFS